MPLSSRDRPLLTAVAARGGLIAVVAVFVVIVATHLDVVPFWDAKNYWGCIEAAAQQPLDVFGFRCAGHSSIAYLWPLGVVEAVWPRSLPLVYAINAALGVASIVAFDAMLRRLFPNRRALEYTLVTALYGLAPLWVAHAIFLNLDYPATAWFVLFLSCLIARRFVSAAACAVLAMFTKETASAACALAVVAHIAAFTLRPHVAWPERWRTLRSYAPLTGVPLALAIFLMLAALSRDEPESVAAAYAPVSIVTDAHDALWNTNLGDPSMRAFLVDIFVLNFQWLYAIVIVIALCAALIRVERSDDDEPADLRRRGLFLTLLLIGLVGLVTRFRFSNNARYVLLASPVVVLAFYHALLSIAARQLARLCYLSVCAALVFASNIRTIDPVSRAIFGTFRFGSHALLHMTSFSGGLRLDSLVYNLEYTNLQYLFGDAIGDLRPPPGSILLMGNVVYNFPPDVDGRTYRPTADRSHAMPFFVAIGDVARDVLASRVRANGEPFYYFAFPNADNEQLRMVMNTYPLIGQGRYERHGYTLEVYTFRFELAPRRVEARQ